MKSPLVIAPRLEVSNFKDKTLERGGESFKQSLLSSMHLKQDLEQVLNTWINLSPQKPAATQKAP